MFAKFINFVKFPKANWDIIYLLSAVPWIFKFMYHKKNSVSIVLKYEEVETSKKPIS